MLSSLRSPKPLSRPPRPPQSSLRIDETASASEDLSYVQPVEVSFDSTLDWEEKKEESTTHRRPMLKKKVAACDVASVGNASDTPVGVYSGRELHEAAKHALNQQDYNRALELFEAILSAQMERFGASHSSVASAMHNVGVVRQRMHQHDLAENLFAEAVVMRTHDSNQLEVAASLSKLGSTRVALGKYDLAFDDLRRACRVAKEELGTQHKTVAQILSHMAVLYFEAGELMSSQATFEDALDIYRAIWAQEHDRDACMMQLTDTLCNIGSIQNKRKKYAAAVATFSEAMDLQRGILDQHHPRLVSTLDNLGYSHSKNKNYASALTCYRTMLRAQLEHTDSYTEECWETCRKAILMLEKLKRIPEAITEARESLRIQKTRLPKDARIIKDTKTLLHDLTRKLQKDS